MQARIEGPGVPSLPIARLSFRAVAAGVLVALVTQVVLLLLGGAIGLTAFEPSGQVARAVGFGFLAWLMLSLCASAFFGAWVAASTAQTVERRDGLLHGLLTWAAVSLVGAFLVGGAVRNTLSGVFGFVGKTVTAAAPAVDGNLDVTGTAIGLWGLLWAFILPLGAALVGGAVGARTERKVLGFSERVEAPTRTRTDELYPTTPTPASP